MREEQARIATLEDGLRVVRELGAKTVVLDVEPQHFDAQLALGMAYYRKGNYEAAIAEGRKAEQLRPQDQLVHTNLSLFYMKAGDKATAEHHGLKARISSWRTDQQPPADAPAAEPELQMAKPKLESVKLPGKFPDMPWKKKTTVKRLPDAP